MSRCCTVHVKGESAARVGGYVQSISCCGSGHVKRSSGSDANRLSCLQRIWPHASKQHCPFKCSMQVGVCYSPASKVMLLTAVQVIMLLLGGFAIAAALSKHFIAKQLAVAILSRVGRKPQYVLLANMLVATFASMWISNVAAPVLCFSLVQPILRTLSPSHAFAKSLVIGIALASNLGGMTSPISSPQNIFAIERMSMDGNPPSWLSWFAVALPVSVLGNLLCWGLILLVYNPGATIKEVCGAQLKTLSRHDRSMHTCPVRPHIVDASQSSQVVQQYAKML